MNNEQLNASLSGLERKLKLLLNEYNALREQTTALRTENQQLKESIKTREDQVKDFQNKYKITKIAGNLKTGESDISDVRNLLNEYIGEIDKCILHLSQG